MCSNSDKRLLTEEEIIDSFFLSCDFTKSGLVPVSELIRCIRKAGGDYCRGPAENADEKFQILLDLLDPDRVNPDVDLETYRSGASRWIESLRCNPLAYDNYMSPDVGTKILMENVVPIPPQSTSTPIIPPVIASIVSPASLEFSSISEDCNVIELQNHIQHLEMHKGRLQEDVLELRQQLNTADDALSVLRQENGALKKESKSLQIKAERMSEIRRENEQLRNELANCKEENLELRLNLAEQKQTNKDITEEMGIMQQQLVTASSEGDCAQEEIMSLHEKLSEKTLNLLNLEESVECLTQKVATKQGMIEALSNKMEEKEEINKSLMRHTSEIEMQLNETQQLVRAQVLELSKRGLCDCSEKNVGDEEDVELMPIQTASSFVISSTPYSANRRSLCQELSSVIINEPVFPSPICDKALDNIFSDVFSVPAFNVELDDPNESIDEDINKNNSSFKMTPRDDRKCITNRKYQAQKKDSVFKKVRELVKISNNEVIFQRELTMFADQILQCTEARISAEHRNVMLLSSLNKIKEHSEEDKARQEKRLNELTCSFNVEVEELKFQLNLQEEMIKAETQRNDKLLKEISSFRAAAVEKSNKDISEGYCSSISAYLPGATLIHEERPLHSSVYESVYRNLSNVGGFRRTVDVLMELFVAFQRRQQWHPHNPHQLMIGYSNASYGVPVLMKNVGVQVDECSFGEREVGVSNSLIICGDRSLVFLLLIVAVTFLFVILNVFCARSCDLFWPMLEELLHPHVHLRHFGQPPV